MGGARRYKFVPHRCQQGGAEAGGCGSSVYMVFNSWNWVLDIHSSPEAL